MVRVGAHLVSHSLLKSRHLFVQKNRRTRDFRGLERVEIEWGKMKRRRRKRQTELGRGLVRERSIVCAGL